MDTKKCPVCGKDMNKVTTLYGKLNTANVVKDWNNQVKRENLALFCCPDCTHGAIDNFLDEEFYTDFSVALGGDLENEAAINQRSEKFGPIIDSIAQISPNTSSLIEIGSGCGYLLHAARQRFSYVMGVEPSKTEYDISIKVAKDCEVVNDVFSPHLKIKQKFSAFVATMVLEHIPDVSEAMHYIYEILAYGGVGYVSVPNAQRAYFGGCYYDIYPQHLHYFTAMSLTKLASDAGFEILYVRESEYKDYLEMAVKKTECEFAGKFNERLNLDRQTLKGYMDFYEKVSLWGASYAARSCVELLDAKKVVHFFDVSPIKIGMYISDFPVMIEKPDKSAVQESDLILIMANEYTNDILHALKSFGYKGDVAGFDENGFLTKYR